MKIWKAAGVTLLLAVLLIASGCSHKGGQMSSLESQVDEQERSIASLEESISLKESELDQYKSQLESEKMKSHSMSMERPMERSMASGDLFPPNAKTGECFTRVYAPASYKTVTERVLKRGASEKMELIPAKYEFVEERVLVSEATQRLEVIPAEYGIKDERVLVKEASSRLEHIPAQYDWEENRMLVKEAHTTWKKGRGPIEKVDNSTGEIMCLVELPAQYRTVRKKVMVSPPRTRTIEIPAQYNAVQKRVVVKPAFTKTIEIPAAYKAVRVRKMMSPPSERKIEIPAEYSTVTRTVLTREGEMEWRRILCETNMTQDMISKLQIGLQKAGFNPGEIDGVLGYQTQKALGRFQRENGLAEGGVTYKSLEKLGVMPAQ